MPIDGGASDGPARSMVVKYNVTNGAIDACWRPSASRATPGLLRHNPLERHLRNVLHGRIHTPQDDTILTATGRAAFAARST